MSKPQLIVNADDLGLSPGVNLAIKEIAVAGELNSASILVNGPYAQAAVIEYKKEYPQLALGVHLTLTYGLSLMHDPLLTDASGYFKNSFMQLLVLSCGWQRRKLISAVAAEFTAQLEQALKMGLSIQHLDGHQHVHMIPAFYNVVEGLAARYKVPRVRFVRENIFRLLLATGQWSKVFSVNLLKALLLNLCAKRIGKKNQCRFFSMLYTCQITTQLVSKLWAQGYFATTDWEIMLHPGYPELDRQSQETQEYDQITQPWRTVERECAKTLKSLQRAGS